MTAMTVLGGLTKKAMVHRLEDLSASLDGMAAHMSTDPDIEFIPGERQASWYADTAAQLLDTARGYRQLMPHDAATADQMANDARFLASSGGRLRGLSSAEVEVGSGWDDNLRDMAARMHDRSARVIDSLDAPAEAVARSREHAPMTKPTLFRTLNTLSDDMSSTAGELGHLQYDELAPGKGWVPWFHATTTQMFDAADGYRQLLPTDAQMARTLDQHALDLSRMTGQIEMMRDYDLPVGNGWSQGLESQVANLRRANSRIVDSM